MNAPVQAPAGHAALGHAALGNGALIGAGARPLTGLRAIVFDLDDTLVDTHAAFQTAIDAGARVLKPGLTGAESADALATWRRDLGGHYRAYTRGEVDYATQRAARVVEIAGNLGLPAPTTDQVQACNAAFDAAFAKGWIRFPDALPTLGWIEERGIAMGVLTNATTALQERKLAATGLDHLPLLVTLDTLGVGKPAPEVFLEAARLLEVDPAHVMYVGDELDTDARGALAAGMHGVWLFRPGRARGGNHDEDPIGAQDSGVHVIESLAQLPQLLLNR